MAKQFTLGKQERLKSRKLIEKLFNEGNKFSVSSLMIFYLLDQIKQPPLQFGVSVSAKKFKRAVDRNRVKRIVRESYRLQKLPLLQQMKEKNKRLSLFCIYTGKELPDYKEIYNTIGLILNKLNKIVVDLK